MDKTETKVGDRFGRLTVTQLVRLPSGKWTRAGAIVRCVCGNEKAVVAYSLKSGNTTSCGCYHKEIAGSGEAGRKVTYTRTRDGKMQTVTRVLEHHGQSKTPLYRQWKGMNLRCNNPETHNYKWYGGKGVRVCPEWEDDFLAYKAWADANGYNPGLELDRIDENGHYGPDNCRFVTKKANIRNRDRGWSDELDAKLVAAAKDMGVSPYELIRLAVEDLLG